MAGETPEVNADAAAQGAPEEAQKLWDEVAAERTAEPEADKAEATSGAKTEDADEAEPDKTADATETKEADPFAGLSPELKARLAKLDELTQVMAEVPALKHSLRTAEGRIAAMASELDVAKRAAKAVQEAPSQTQIAAAAKSVEKWDALKVDFPEWAEATEAFVQSQLATIPKPKESAPGITQEQVTAQIQARLDDVRREMEMERVAEHYENWRDVVKTPEFVAWFAVQDDTTKALANSPKGRDAIQMLDLYHKAKPASQVQAERKNLLAQAASTKPNGTATNVGKTPESMSPAELWEYERKRAAKRGSASGLTY